MNILELRLATNHLATLRDFYVNTLEFPLLDEDANHLMLGAGKTRLVFEQGDAAIYHVAFNIPENRLVEAKSWLAQRVPLLTFQGKDEVDWPAWNAHALYFFDPAGNIMEFIARHNLANASSEPFESRSIREVSEIGLVTANVGETTSALREALGIGAFDAGDGEMFTALGDEHGLFITVKQGRAWFPTSDSYSDFYRLALTIRGEETKHHILPGLPYTINTAASLIERGAEMPNVSQQGEGNYARTDGFD